MASDIAQTHELNDGTTIPAIGKHPLDCCFRAAAITNHPDPGPVAQSRAESHMRHRIGR